MLFTTTAWTKAWIYFGFLFGWTLGARPQFDSSTNMGLVLVPADAEVDSVIFRLRATDQDADFPLIFDVTAAVQPIVRIENLPCTLYNKVCQANVILTRRLVPGRLHDFAVRVRDSKGDQNSMQATISVTNATTSRDMIFPHVPSIIMVPEDTRPGKELDYLLVRANPWHGKPVYIELWQPKELFTIRQRQTPSQTRGVITLIGELDFETQSMYTLTMYATDPWTEVGKDTRNIAGVHVVVIVQDVQDVPPVFTIAPPLTRINNSVKPGDVIMRVHAEDGDKGTPREVTYGLVSEGNPFTPFFNISEWTGEIFLARPLEELTQITHVGAPILLTVVAEEVRRSQEEPPAQATVVELGLLLGEPGNSPPYFESDSYVAWMDENAMPGTVVMFDKPYLTRVRDEDIGKTGVFALKLGNNNGTFEIMPTVAERSAEFVVTVRDNALMDYEMRKSLEFMIIAQEVGPATNLSTSVPVTIFLKDVNDNPPKFEKELYEVTLVENVSPGTRVIQVHASDNDTGLFGSVRYTGIIGPGNETLTMNSESGLIVVSSSSTGFDREMTESLHLLVEATDENGKGLRSTVPLIINLLDVNDNAPIFEKSVYEFVLNSDRKNFTNPAFIRAVDADSEPPNNVVRYELVHGNYENKFNLNEVTGELILREPLSKSRRRRNNAYLNFGTKFHNNFINTLDTFRKIRASTDKPLKIWKNRKKRATDNVLYALTVRAYDMGVPHLSSTAQVHIVTAAPMGALTLMLVVPAEHLDPARTTATLAAITGGRVTIQEIRPYDQPGPPKNGTVQGGKMSLIVARVEPTTSGTFLVDVEKIHKSLVANGMDIVPVVDPNTSPESRGPVDNTAEGSVESTIGNKNAGTLGATSGGTVIGNGANSANNSNSNTVIGVNGGAGGATGSTGGSGTNGGTNGGNGDVTGGNTGKETGGDAAENKGETPGVVVNDSKGGSNEGTAGGGGDAPGTGSEGGGTSGGNTVVGIPGNNAGTSEGNLSGSGTSDGAAGGQTPGNAGGTLVGIGSGETAVGTAADRGGDSGGGNSGTSGNIGGIIPGGIGNGNAGNTDGKATGSNGGGIGDVNAETTNGKTAGSKDGDSASGTGGVAAGGTAAGGGSGGVNVNANINEINKTISRTENEYIVYKAENKLLLWLLILLGLLMLLALLGLILCCICPGCPFYMAPRKRRVHSFETMNYQDGRPKRHLRRKQANVVKGEWSGKKQAWSADPMRRNWQFNRRNTKNRGIASLPGDVAVISTPQEFQQAPSLRLRDGPEPWSVQHATRKHQDLDRLYVEDVETGRPYDIEDIDSLRRHEMERGSDAPRHSYQQADDTSRLPREQHYYRDGNAEVLRLVTRGHDEGRDISPRAERPITLVTEQQALGYRSDGKDILLRRFIEDQKMRQQHDIHGSIQEMNVDSLEPRPRGGEQFMQKHEVILIPDNLERDLRQHHEVRSPSIQRLIIDHGDLEGEEELKAQSQQLRVHEEDLQQQRKLAAAMLVSTVVTRATEKPPLNKIIGHSGSSLNVSSTYASRDIELARQNVLLTQLLMDRDVKHIGVPGLDPGSYLETQSLPGQVAIATQTDRTASTQTDNYIQVRSRSDNDESEDEIRSRRKSKSKKRFGSEMRRSRSIWLKSPIQEESRSFSETRSSLLRRKTKEGREGRRATLEPDVLREISDSLDEQVSSPSPEEPGPENTRNRMTQDANYKSKMGGDSIEDEEKQLSEIPAQSSPEMSKDKYHRRSHENTGIVDAIGGQRLGSSGRKQQSPPRSKTRSQKSEMKSTESKKAIHTQSEKKESDTTSTDAKSVTKKRIVESRSSNGGTDSKKENDDKKKSRSKLLSKAVILKSASEKSDSKNKHREKEEAPITKKRTLLRHQKAKKVSTESSEFEEFPNKSRQLSVKTKPAKRADSTSDSNLKQNPTKIKGTSTLSDEPKSHSSGTDHSRSQKQQYQRLSDSTSSSGRTVLQNTVKDKTINATAPDIKETEKVLEDENKIARDSHIQQNQLENQLKRQMIQLPASIIMSKTLDSDDTEIKNGEVKDVPETTSKEISEIFKPPRSQLDPEVPKSNTILMESQFKPTAPDVSIISENPDEGSSKLIRESLEPSEISPPTEKADSDEDKLLKSGISSPNQTKEVDVETSVSTVNIPSSETQHDLGTEKILEAVEKIAESVDEKSRKELPKEKSEPLKLSEIDTASEKERVEQHIEEPLKVDKIILQKPEEASKPTTNIPPIEMQPELDTAKVSVTTEKIPENLKEAKPELVSDVPRNDDKKISSADKESERNAKEAPEDNKEILNESREENLDVAKPGMIIIPSEEKQPDSSVSGIPLGSENIQEKPEEQVDETSKAGNMEAETLSEDMQPGPSAKEVTQMFLQSESAQSSRDLQVANEKVEDEAAPRAMKSVPPDRSDACQQEMQNKDMQDGTKLVTDKNDGTETGPTGSSLPTTNVALSAAEEVENLIKTPHNELEKTEDEIPATSDMAISQPRVLPAEEKRSNKIEEKNDSSQTELKNESTGGSMKDETKQKPAENKSEDSAAKPSECIQPLTIRSPSPKHESVTQSDSEVPKGTSEGIEKKVDKQQSTGEPVRENSDRKSPKQMSSHDSQEEYFPRSGSPSFYILSSASSAEEFAPDQGMSHGQVKPDQPLPEKTTSPVSDAFTLLKNVENPPEQSRKQGPEDEQSGLIASEIRSRPSGLLGMQPPDWDSQQIGIGDISSDSPDNAQPYQTPRHRSKNRTSAVIAIAPGIKSEPHPVERERSVPSVSHSTLPPDENLEVKKKSEGEFESSDERSSDSTSRMKKLYQLTPKMIAEEAIRSGLKEIISDQSGFQKKESSSQTSAKTSPENRRTETPKRKPGKEARGVRAAAEARKPARERAIPGSQSIKKIEDPHEQAASSNRPKTEPKGGNLHSRETQPVRPRTQRGKPGDSHPAKSQEVPIREPRQDVTTRRSKLPEKIRQQESQTVEEVKPEDLAKSKVDEGPKEGHMSRYKQKREEMERKRKELKAAAEEEQRPRWQRKPIVPLPQRSSVKESSKKETQTEGKFSERTTPRTRRKVKPLANAESEQLRAMVKEGRRQRRADGGDSDDPTVEIFAPEPPLRGLSTDHSPTGQQAVAYQYEKIPPPFYLHPPPPPQSTPQISPLHAAPPDTRRPDDDLDSGIAVSLQGGTKLRHQQLLEKKSVFDIAYSDAAPAQLRTDSTTPPS